MTENPNQPKAYDVVMGSQNSLPVNAAILGGIEEVKRRLAYSDVEVRVAALKDAFKYGEAGLDLVIQSLQDEATQVKFTAYSLLKDRTEPKVKQQIDNLLPFFGFDVITVNEFGQEIRRYRQFAQYFTEDLGNGLFLEMVLIIGGTFLMGSPDMKTEKAWLNRESPQHQVTVPSFFMGKYEVTQDQWKAVAALPRIKIYLKANPSYRFKGANRPVDKVSWNEAQEFCARLSRKTGKTYRLPSEAEWEYACRAGTTTPFYFGETITTDLVNHDGSSPYTYTDSYNRKTTDVGSFLPNAFGLYDMHGNVWEWCADAYHENYNGAPNDGSVWESAGDNKCRLLRGGSLWYEPDFCRSAYRGRDGAGRNYFPIGFRVVYA